MNTDLEHKLLKGSPIYCGDIPIYSITLGEMVDFPYSYSMCNYVINTLCMDDDKVPDMAAPETEKSTLHMIFMQMHTELSGLQNGTIPADKATTLLVTSLSPFLEMLLKAEVKYDFVHMRFIIDNGKGTKYLDKSNYDDFRNILKERNCFMDVEELNENPADERVKALLDRKRELKKRLKKHKFQNNDTDEDSLTMVDLISIFAESNHMSLQDIYNNYDIYQFNNQFNRLKIMEDYQVNIKALLAGAKNEDINLQHWLSKIRKPEN